MPQIGDAHAIHEYTLRTGFFLPFASGMHLFFYFVDQSGSTPSWDRRERGKKKPEKIRQLIWNV